MNLKEYDEALLKIQNSIYSPIRLNDAIIDIIEIDFTDTGEAVYCPPHTHTWFEFNYVTYGSFFTSFGSEIQEIKEGMFFIIPPGAEHSHQYNNKNPHKDILLRWQLKKADEAVLDGKNSLYNELEPLYFWDSGCFQDTGTIRSSLEHLLKNTKNNVHPVSLQMDFINILFALVDINSHNLETQKYDKDIVGKTIIKKVEVYLNDLQDADFDVQKLAASLHMSYGHLARLYKKYSGQTILDRLGSIRLEKSFMLLAQTDYSMKEIAEKLGFSNQYYFSKVFKEKNGISPSQYRKAYAEEISKK